MPYSYVTLIGSSWWWNLRSSMDSFIFFPSHKFFIVTCKIYKQILNNEILTRKTIHFNEILIFMIIGSS